MKKVLSMVVCLMLLAGLISGCGKSSTSSDPTPNTSEQTSQETDTPSSEAEPVTISILQGQPEYTDAYNAYISEYKKVAPNVTIDLQVLQADYPTVLKSRIAAGSIPDIFMTTAGGELKAYAEYSADLSNEPLASAMSESVKKDMTYDGKLMGVPLVMDSFPLIYNKKLFADAGITEMPKTLAELEEVCKKLESKGITPFANAYKEWWVQKHIFQHFIVGASSDPAKLVSDFIAGNTKFEDHPVLLNYFDFIDLTVKYGDPKPLECDFNAQVGTFANGKAAIVTGQGQWIESGVTKIDPDFDFGVMLYPVSDDPSQANVCAGSAQCLRVHKDSEVLTEAKNLLNWLYTSDYGKKWFGEVAKVISPVKDAAAPDMKIPAAFAELTKVTPSSGAPVNYSLDSFHQKFGEIMQAYIGGAKTRDQAVEEIQNAWVKLGAAN
ncbi:MAG TPA: extracellular solute-binding protein [Clostridiaceae bacterium]|nr:extracellular solute-binding protein [Clostridiaceae bacterium]